MVGEDGRHLSGYSEPDWEQLSIETPELVAIDMPMAGIGSRFVALFVDYAIWAVGIIAFVLIFALVDPSLNHFSKLGEKWEIAITIFIPFLVYWGYFTLFEAFWNGQTPGKRVVKIRVIQRSGRGIGLFESMTRNLLRVVDQIPGFYGVGVICIFLSKQQQRLGDLAAGTLVVHERENLNESSSAANTRTFTAGVFDPPPMADLRPRDHLMSSSQIRHLNAADLEVLEGFFARRLDFTMETRERLAARISGVIRTKTGIPMPDGVSTETFLEEVARKLRDQARMF
jgi:uncharacterized RDD family membrane protein YckC